MNESNMSSTATTAVSTNDSHTNVECQKAIHKESTSPPNIFNNSNSLKYLHKKFKRVASAIIEEHCDKIKANANLSSTTTTTTTTASTVSTAKSPLFNNDSVDVALSFNLNGETTASASTAAATITTKKVVVATPVTAVQSSHINESEINSQNAASASASAFDAVKCIQCRKSLVHPGFRYCYKCNPELINANTKYGQIRNEFDNKNVNAELRGGGGGGGGVGVIDVGVGTRSARVQRPPHKQFETDLINSLSKCKTENSIRLHQQLMMRYEHYSLKTEDNRIKNIGDAMPQINDFIKIDYVNNAADIAYNLMPINLCGESSNSSSANKTSIRRKNHDKAYPCITCGIEFKSRSQYIKHCRFVKFPFCFFFIFFFFY